MNHKLMIIAGEESGDMHGANLIKELKNIDPSIDIFGIGGDKMISAGMDAQFNIRQMAFLGFIEIIRHLPFINKVKHKLLKKIDDECINTIVLIDYPGFNLNLAKQLHKSGKKIIYYISPQIWAWGLGRIRKIGKLVNKMIVVFQFEEKLYRDEQIDVEYVGHPLIEQLENYSFSSKDDLFKKLKLDKRKEILLVLPGSRKQEIKKIFPECIKAAERIAKEFNLQTVVACSENIDETIFSNLSLNTNYIVAKGNTYDLMKYSVFGIIKSGTSTLEAGYFQLPFVVVYSTNILTYWIGKKVVKINNIAMANIILNENVVDELIQKDVNSANIYKKCSTILNDKANYDSIKLRLGKLKDKLGGIGASRKTALLIYKLLNEA